MDTVALEEYKIAYTAIPRCANTSIKLALFELQTGKKFKRYGGEGPLWPHSTSDLEVHRNDIKEFNYLTEMDTELINSHYDFWFTVVSSPIRRLFSSYYMLILLEDPHLKTMRRGIGALRTLENISYCSISAHFEEFIKSDALKSLMEVDVHFIPQSTLIEREISSNRLRVYGLEELKRVEEDVNNFIKPSVTRKFQLERSNISLVTIEDIFVSLESRRIVDDLYQQDIKMLKSREIEAKVELKAINNSTDERLLSIAINDIRARNRRISAMYERYLEDLSLNKSF